MNNFEALNEETFVKMTPENIKCGEIIRYAPGKYKFNCSHCTESFTRKSAALNHFESHFTVKSSTSTIKLVDFNIEEQPEEVTDSKDHIQAVVANIKQENPLEICSENTFLFDQTLNEIHCISEQTSVGTTLESTYSNLVKNPVEPDLTLKIDFKWGPTYTLVDCDICGRKMRKSNVMRHLLTHVNQKEHICKVCNRSFKHKYLLKRHAPIHSTTKRYSCDHCGWQFHDRSSLVVHIRKHTGEKPYKCNICDKSFAVSSTLKKHSYTHTFYKPYKCKLCYQSFTKNVSLQIHENRHNTASDLILNMHFKWGPTYAMVDCDICGRKLKKDRLKNHFLSHLNQKEFICAICNRGFNNKDQLKKHSLIHSATKRYSCEHCGWQFHDHNNLRVHIRKHTGEKPYKCEICDKSFATHSTFKTHTRTHTGDKPYKCKLCDQSFAHRISLQLHVKRYHGPQQCKLCENKSFETSIDLKNHMQSMHARARPYVCEVCNSSYPRQEQYNQHILLFTGAKTYKCRVCDAYFHHTATRRIHEKSIHKEVAHLLINT